MTTPIPLPFSATSKFATRDFKGRPVRYFRVERQDLSSSAAPPARPLSDLILVFDRSGSMYGVIEDVKASALKTLTVEELNDPDLRVSLITYSGRGDVKLHFHRVSVADIMATNSTYQKEIRAIQATYLTCISQALEMVDTLIDDTRVTGVLLHTDGCANDSSPSAERRALEAAASKMKRHPNLFVNTVAHGSWADTNTLMSIAGSLSGKMLQARDQRGIHQALHDTAAVLVGNAAPALEVPMGSADYALFVSRADAKVLGGHEALQVRGLTVTADRAAYRLYAIDAAAYAACPAPVAGEAASAEPVYAYARTQLSAGNPLEAKYALLATRSSTLVPRHTRAQVPSALAAFAEDLDAAITSGSGGAVTADYGLPVRGPSALAVIACLNRHAADLEVNLPEFTRSYKRRSLKRVPGTRNADGSITPPAAEARVRSADPWVSVSGFNANRDTATVNMLITRPQDIYRLPSGEKVDAVAGVDLTGMSSFNNYTIVANGEVTARALSLRLKSKQLHRELRDLGAITGDYTPGVEVSVDLSEMPLVDYDASFAAPTRPTINQLLGLTAVNKFLGGMLKGESTTLTAEQIAALDALHISPGLSFSPPTTNSYTSLEEALKKGEVDTRLDFKVNFGTTEITNASKLPSGNAFLARRFTLTLNGAEVAKPTLESVGAKGAVWGVKKLTARTQLNATDALVYPLYAGLLGLEESTELNGLLSLAGVDRAALVTALTGADREAAVSAADAASSAVGRAVDLIWDGLRPVSFFIGAAGLVPDSLGARPISQEELEKRFPEAKLAKAEKDDGLFYLLGDDVLLTVYVSASHFTVSGDTSPAA